MRTQNHLSPFWYQYMSIKVAQDFIFLLKILHIVHWNCYQINHSILYIFHKKMKTLDQVANIVHSSNFLPSPHPCKWQKRWLLKYWSYYNWAEQETVPNTNQKFWNKKQKDKNQTRSTCWGKKTQANTCAGESHYREEWLHHAPSSNPMHPRSNSEWAKITGD